MCTVRVRGGGEEILAIITISLQYCTCDLSVVMFLLQVLYIQDRIQTTISLIRGTCTSLVPRPSLTAFFAAVAKKHAFCHGCGKSCEGRPGYEASTCPQPITEFLIQAGVETGSRTSLVPQTFLPRLSLAIAFRWCV